MKRLFSNLSVFAVAFIFGCLAALIFNLGVAYTSTYLGELKRPPETVTEARCIATGEIDIKVENIAGDTEHIGVKITNRSCRPAVYFSYSPDQPLPYYADNGKVRPEWYCGLGMKGHTLQPGQTLEVKGFVGSMRPEKNSPTTFRYGADFEFEGSEKQRFWSNEFRLNEK